jgi:hypothetical protein
MDMIISAPTRNNETTPMKMALYFSILPTIQLSRVFRSRFCPQGSRGINRPWREVCEYYDSYCSLIPADADPYQWWPPVALKYPTAGTNDKLKCSWRSDVINDLITAQSISNDHA